MGKSSKASESVYAVIAAVAMLTTLRAVAARETAASKPTVGTATNAPPLQSTQTEAKPIAPNTVKKDLKKSLKGVVVKKKKLKPAALSPSQGDGGPKGNSDSQSEPKRERAEAAPDDSSINTDTERESKRRKVSDSKG